MPHARLRAALRVERGCRSSGFPVRRRAKPRLRSAPSSPPSPCCASGSRVLDACAAPQGRARTPRGGGSRSSRARQLQGGSSSSDPISALWPQWAKLQGGRRAIPPRGGTRAYARILADVRAPRRRRAPAPTQVVRARASPRSHNASTTSSMRFGGCSRLVVNSCTRRARYSKKKTGRKSKASSNATTTRNA